MQLIDNLMMQLRASVNRGEDFALLNYHLGRIHGFIYSLEPSDKTAAYRNEAFFLVNNYSKRVK